MVAGRSSWLRQLDEDPSAAGQALEAAHQALEAARLIPTDRERGAAEASRLDFIDEAEVRRDPAVSPDAAVV